MNQFERLTFYVRSSDGEGTYLVEFLFESDVLKIRCNCKAGALGQNCKHKDCLIDGRTDILASRNEDASLATALGWVANSAVAEARRRIRDLEHRTDLLQQELKREKIAFARLIRP